MQRVGHYRLDERIGAGGMGEVFRARDLALGRSAAVKLMLPGGDPGLRDRLLLEVQHSARLQHPGIATFFDGGVEGDRAWLALEYVDGETLRARLRRGALPLADAVAIGIALLEALAHAHAAGVLHRDLKPENVMLRADDELDVAAPVAGRPGRPRRGWPAAVACRLFPGLRTPPARQAASRWRP